MELKDLIVAQIILLITYILAYRLRPKITDLNTKRYFIPALTVKIIGAISAGLIYQFYYKGGDTFNFHTHGSLHIWEALMNEPYKGLKLLLSNGADDPETFNYYSKIYFYKDKSSYLVIKIAAILDFFTFGSYTGTAILFAVFSFSGFWALYTVFYNKFKHLHLQFAIAVFFMPSVFFWGSGIFKDTITLGALGWMTYSINKVFFLKTKVLINTIIFTVSAYLIFIIKIYMLLCFLPAIIIWVFIAYFDKLKSILLKIILTPITLIITLLAIYYTVLSVGKDDPRYSLENISKTSRITAYDLAYYTGKDAGSTYDLGELDGTFENMIKLAPQAINTSLFRPYLWEIKNPLMIFSAIESFFVTLLTIYVLFKNFVFGVFRKLSQPIILFCITFSLVFAFGVGISTYNFGTLSRYKIPLIPFYLSGLFLLLEKREKIVPIR